MYLSDTAILRFCKSCTGFESVVVVIVVVAGGAVDQWLWGAGDADKGEYGALRPSWCGPHLEHDVAMCTA